MKRLQSSAERTADVSSWVLLYYYELDSGRLDQAANAIEQAWSCRPTVLDRNSDLNVTLCSETAYARAYIAKDIAGAYAALAEAGEPSKQTMADRCRALAAIHLAEGHPDLARVEVERGVASLTQRHKPLPDNAQAQIDWLMDLLTPKACEVQSSSD